MIAILNSTILTSFGNFSYTPLEINEAKKLLSEGFESFVGHDATNKMIELLLDVEVPYSREMYKQDTGAKAIVFKLNKRLDEGELLNTKEAIEEIGYTMGLLIKN